MFVYLPVCVCSHNWNCLTYNFNFKAHIQYHHILDDFEGQGHRSKVKVTKVQITTSKTWDQRSHVMMVKGKCMIWHSVFCTCSYDLICYTVVCNLVKKQVSALSDTQDSLSRVSESAENWLASQLPPMTDDTTQIFLSEHGYIIVSNWAAFLMHCYKYLNRALLVFYWVPNVYRNGFI